MKIVVIDRIVVIDPIRRIGYSEYTSDYGLLSIILLGYYEPFTTRALHDCMENLPAKVNICPDWTVGSFCLIALKDDYLRRSCRVCAIANECWPGIHEGSIHSMQSGQSVIRKEKKEA